MAWFYNTISGELTDITSTGVLGTIESAPYQVLGWHKVNVADTATKAEAATAAEAQFHGATPTTSLLGGLKNEPAGAVDVSGNQFLGLLTGKGLWSRVTEGLIGGALLIIGVLALTGATGAAKNVAKSKGIGAAFL